MTSLLICATLAAAVLIFGAGIYVGMTRGVPFVGTEKRFSIGIYAGDSPLQLAAAAGVINPVLTAKDVTDVAASFLADPFMMHEGGQWYMFFEVMNRRTKRGEIGLATSPDAFHWHYQRIVLREPFHLSYPQVFRVGSTCYMVPETCRAQAIRLYRASRFPDRWEFCKTLLEGASYSDATVFQHRGRFWLFTTTKESETLRLFFADDLLGDWHEHPCSPVVHENPHIARPAGSVICEADGRLLRFAQDDYPVYGKQVWALAIALLNPTDYQEERLGPAPVLKPGSAPWSQYAMHHIDAHRLDSGQWIACVDGLGKYRVFGLKH